MYGFCRYLKLYSALLVVAISACGIPPTHKYELGQITIRANSELEANKTGELTSLVLPKLQERLHIDSIDPLDIWIISSGKFNKQREHEHLVAYNQRVALGSHEFDNRIILPEGYQELSYLHELTHGLMPFSAINKHPIWFNEGLAEWVSLPLAPPDQRKYREAQLFRKLLVELGLKLEIVEGFSGESFGAISYGNNTPLLELFNEQEFIEHPLLPYAIGWLMFNSIGQNEELVVKRVANGGVFAQAELFSLAGWDEQTGGNALQAIIDFEKNEQILVQILEPFAKYLITELGNSSSDTDAMQVLTSALTLDLWLVTPWGKRFELRAHPEWEQVLRKVLTSESPPTN